MMTDKQNWLPGVAWLACVLLAGPAGAAGLKLVPGAVAYNAGGFVRIAGEIHNNTGQTVCAARVEVFLKDAAGKPIQVKSVVTETKAGLGQEPTDGVGATREWLPPGEVAVFSYLRDVSKLGGGKPAAHELRASARACEGPLPKVSVEDFKDKTDSLGSHELTGVLRLSTAFVVMEHLLPQPLADFARAFPGIEVEVVENAFLVDLARRHADSAGAAVLQQADVALRLSAQVAEHLVGRQLGMTHCRVYARRGAPGLPQTVQPLPTLLRDAPWVAFERDGLQRVYDRWMVQQLAQAQVRVRVDIFNAVAAMLRTGIGVGVLPTFMEASHPELVAVSDPIPELSVPVWMLTHPDLRQTARVRAFMQHVGDALATRLREQA